MNLLSSLMLKIALLCNHIRHSGTYASNNQSTDGNNVNGTPSLDVYLYSMNLNASQGNQYDPCAVPDANKLQLWKDQSYGTLVMSNEASKNEDVPIWGVINERLKNVDLYLKAVVDRLSNLYGWESVGMNCFGVSGVLKLYNGTNDAAEEPVMYALDTDRKLIVRIPKLIYRVIHGEWVHERTKIYEAVVIIHNDPRSKYNINGLDCERIRGWDLIENLFNETGLAYACRPTEEINRILGINCSTMAKPLELRTISMCYSERPGWLFSYPYPVMYRDYTYDIYKKYVNFCDQGCCFLTYYTRKAALDAQNALHNIKILPGMHHPIQMKPADSENRNERKLFVGMLSKKCNETDIRNMFEHFGTIEECTVLRDNQGISKGCAFVTYTSKQCAINAIKTMHQSHTMEGCSSPLVVKFADTQKDKDQKKLQQMQSSIWNMAGINFSPQHYLATAALSQQFAPNANETTQCLTPLQLLQQQLQASAAVTNGHSNMNNSLNGLLLHNSQSSDLHGLSNLNGSCHNISDINPVNLQSLATLANLSVTNAAVNPIHMQNLISLAALTGGNSMSPSGSTANLTNSALSGLANTAAAALLGKKASGLLTSNATPLSALTSNTATLNGFTSNTLSLSELSGSVLGSTNISRDIAINAAGKQIEGPVGANLFIYHLPQDCTDLDLASMFTPFGTLISAKVYIDKDTKRSKCFGFVSYDNVLNAQHAIQSMNGYPIGTKRLKVEPKRRKDSKPY